MSGAMHSGSNLARAAANSHAVSMTPFPLLCHEKSLMFLVSEGKVFRLLVSLMLSRPMTGPVRGQNKRQQRSRVGQ